jgi:hypothetical protein
MMVPTTLLDFTKGSCVALGDGASTVGDGCLRDPPFRRTGRRR